MSNVPNVLVYSRAAIERLAPHEEPHVLISISTTEDDPARVPASAARVGLLRLSFPDLETAQHGFREEQLFSKTHAQLLWSFLYLHRKHYELVVVHCDAGMSRSPGVAAAITRCLGGEDEYFFRRYHPNGRVVRLLCEVFDEEFRSRFFNATSPSAS